MAPDDVVRRLIQELRALKGSWWEAGASRLALALEWKLAQSPDREPWRLRLTGDDEHDRLVLADWLLSTASGPPVTSPSRTRRISEDVGWALYSRRPITTLGLALADRNWPVARRQAFRARVMSPTAPTIGEA
jgi:hypothetical protein